MLSSKAKSTMVSKTSGKGSRALEDLQTGIKDRKQRLTAVLKGFEDKPKWTYPKDAMDIIQEAQQAAIEHWDLVREGLTRLLEWPSKEMASDDFFYEATGPNSMFDRNSDWFDKQGFHRFDTNYSFSDRWDKQELSVTIYVPKHRTPGREAPVMWFFHGGGFCTGASDFIPWYSQTSVRRAKEKGAIIIAPDYPLGPEGNYADIHNALYDFLRWYKEDGCFESDFDNWQDWLRHELADNDFTIAKHRVYIEGESAGAHAAVSAIWLNASTTEGFNMPISAVLLRYPMITHYTRQLPPNNKKVAYMGTSLPQDAIKRQAKAIEEEILLLERLDILPTCTRRSPPHGMAFAFLLSTTQTWRSFFQREHGHPRLNICPDPSDEKAMDCVERAERCAQATDVALLPPMYTYHGYNDGNCPVGDTVRFVDVLRSLYGDRFKDESVLCLDVVRRLSKAAVWDAEEKVLRYREVGEVPHGFDYSLDEENEGFLKRAYDWVGRYWGV